MVHRRIDSARRQIDVGKLEGRWGENLRKRLPFVLRQQSSKEKISICVLDLFYASIVFAVDGNRQDYWTQNSRCEVRLSE